MSLINEAYTPPVTPAGKTRFSTWERPALEHLAEELSRELKETKEELALALKFWRREVQKSNSASDSHEQR